MARKGTGDSLLQSPAFSPRSVAGLVGWWRPEELGSYADAASLTSWTDASGNGRTATPYVAVKPVVKRAIQNGRDVARFAGTTDVLGFTTTGALLSWTVFLACGGLSVATNAIDYAVAQTGGGLAVGGTNATFGFLGEVKDGTNYRVTATKPTAWGIDCWTPAAIYRDNVAVASALTGTVDRFDLTDLGGRNDAANLGVIGDIGEVLIYNAVLSALDQERVWRYLRVRWGTA